MDLEMVVTALLFHIAEPTENLADVPEDQIVETIETSDGPVASTVEHVHEIAKDVHKLALFSVCLRLSLSLSHLLINYLVPYYSLSGISLCSLPLCGRFDPSRCRLTDPYSAIAQSQARVQDQTTQCSRTYTRRPNGKQSTSHVSAWTDKRAGTKV